MLEILIFSLAIAAALMIRYFGLRLVFSTLTRKPDV